MHLPLPATCPVRRFRSRLLALGLAACVLATHRDARAQDPAPEAPEDAQAADAPAEPSPPDEAIEAYQIAREHYKAGRYPAAIDELERALTLDPDSPELLYNVARVYELMGDLGKAASYYVRYKAMLPASETEERARVEETLARLRGARKYVEPGGATQPEPSAAEPEAARDPRKTLPVWTLLSLAGGSLVSGSVCGGIALSREKELQSFVLGPDGGIGQRRALSTNANRLALASDVLLGVSAVSAMTALVLHLTLPASKPAAAREKAHGPSFQWSADAGPEHATLTLRGRF